MTFKDITKVKFINEYLSDELFFTEKTSEVKSEVYNNCLSISKNDIKEYVQTANEMALLITYIIEKKDKEIKKVKNRKMIFYCWCDFQSGHFKLNFININH